MRETLDQIRCRQDDEYYRNPPPRDPRSDEEVERDLRASYRAEIAELHAKPWLYGSPRAIRDTVAWRRLWHTQSIARSVAAARRAAR